MVETATFGAGCFWGVESTFRKLKGVTKTSVGYMGGRTETPTYEEVCTDTTGHAEVCQVEFDPAVVGYEALLDAFWECHDPTQLNYQGPDFGTQYRSAVFFHTPGQEAAARASKDRLEASKRHRRPVVTEITPAGAYWLAEDYHQQYFERSRPRPRLKLF